MSDSESNSSSGARRFDPLRRVVAGEPRRFVVQVRHAFCGVVAAIVLVCT